MNLYVKTLSTGTALFIAAVSIIMCFSSCRQAVVNQQEPESEAVLSVYFFHLTARCEACNAIESNTGSVLEKYFKDLLDSGTIRFKSINIESRENRALAEKYQVSYTSLLLVRSDGTVNDFTNTALNYAFMNPARFEELLRAEIDKNLK